MRLCSFDDLVPQHLQRTDFAGAVIAVVKDGRVLFAKCYAQIARWIRRRQRLGRLSWLRGLG
jgi:hypothetical protein